MNLNNDQNELLVLELYLYAPIRIISGTIGICYRNGQFKLLRLIIAQGQEASGDDLGVSF